MCLKYLTNLTLEEWFRDLVKYAKGLIVWEDLVEAFPLVGEWTVWKVGNGCYIIIGEDPWLEVGNYFRL
jgi:hypothetical protein